MNPSQVIQYLGSVFDTRQGIIYPLEEMYQTIVEEITLLTDKNVSAQSILRLLGLMASVIDLTPWARLHSFTCYLFHAHTETVFYNLFQLRKLYSNTWNGGINRKTLFEECPYKISSQTD
jgi:hypothetical protein